MLIYGQELKVHGDRVSLADVLRVLGRKGTSSEVQKLSQRMRERSIPHCITEHPTKGGMQEVKTMNVKDLIPLLLLLRPNKAVCRRYPDAMNNWGAAWIGAQELLEHLEMEHFE